MIKPERGFTLIELLVAIGISMIVIMAAYTVYFSIRNGTAEVYGKIRAKERAYNFLGMVRKEIEGAYYYSAVPYTGFKLEDRDVYGKPASKIMFTSFFKDGVKVVTYGVKEDGDGLLRLVKTVADPLREDMPVTVDVLKDIEGFRVRILDPGFDRVFDSEKLGRLPKNVKVTLVVKSGEGTEEFSQICGIMTAQ